MKIPADVNNSHLFKYFENFGQLMYVLNIVVCLDYLSQSPIIYDILF